MSSTQAGLSFLNAMTRVAHGLAVLEEAGDVFCCFARLGVLGDVSATGGVELFEMESSSEELPVMSTKPPFVTALSCMDGILALP